APLRHPGKQELVIILIVLVIGPFIVSKAKKKYKKDAYRLLKKSDPSSKDIKETIKALNRYIGRWSKDEEAAQLIKRLMDKLDQLSE
ncbi:MAG: hypothetical protein V3T73_00675, partial [Dehalococcoidales bacterium]